MRAIRDLKRGDRFTFIKFEELDYSWIWVRGPFSSNKLGCICYKLTDMSVKIYLDGDKVIYDL